MPIEELTPTSHINKQVPAQNTPQVAPQDPEQDFYDRNIFNAMLGRRFKCNVCEEHHEASPRAIIQCFFRKLPYDNVMVVLPEIKTFKLSIRMVAYRMHNNYHNKTAGALYHYLFENEYHSSLFAIGKKSKICDENEIRITTEEKWIKLLSKVLASKDKKIALNDFLIESYQDYISSLKSIKQEIISSDYDMSKFVTLTSTKFYDNNFNRWIDERKIMGYYYRINDRMLIQRFDTSGSQIKISGKDLYLLLPSDGISFLFRLSLKNDYIPKIHTWQNIDRAVQDCPETSWSILRKIEY